MACQMEGSSVVERVHGSGHSSLASSREVAKGRWAMEERDQWRFEFHVSADRPIHRADVDELMDEAIR
jgi:hypothetical protein